MSRQSEWVERAICLDLPLEVFFPSDLSPNRYDRAKQVCAQCPVTQQCLDLALQVEDLDDKWGVFGGLTPAERADIRYKKSRNIL